MVGKSYKEASRLAKEILTSQEMRNQSEQRLSKVQERINSTKSELRAKLEVQSKLQQSLCQQARCVGMCNQSQRPGSKTTSPLT
mgnify:CR=1 FL=1